MMDAAAREDIDKLVLLSGDGDFDRLLQRISSGNGKQTVVYGVPQLTAASLVNAASTFYPIDSALLMTK